MRHLAESRAVIDRDGIFKWVLVRKYVIDTIVLKNGLFLVSVFGVDVYHLFLKVINFILNYKLLYFLRELFVNSIQSNCHRKMYIDLVQDKFFNSLKILLFNVVSRRNYKINKQYYLVLYKSKKKI